MNDIRSALHQWHEMKRRLLASMPELADDEECLIDTLDGLTDLKEQMAGILRSALKEEAEAKGLAEYIESLLDRKSAKVERAKKKRRIVLHFMEDAGLKRLDQADFTASRRAVAPSVSVYDEDALPEQYWRIKREPNLSEIKSALKSGTVIPGCRLGNASATLSIKV